MLQIKMENGETIVGTPNYVTVATAEIRLAGMNGKVTGYRTIERAQIKSTARVSPLTGRTTAGDLA